MSQEKPVNRFMDSPHRIQSGAKFNVQNRIVRSSTKIGSSANTTRINRKLSGSSQIRIGKGLPQKGNQRKVG